jgi:hypothetical protein
MLEVVITKSILINNYINYIEINYHLGNIYFDIFDIRDIIKLPEW